MKVIVWYKKDGTVRLIEKFKNDKRTEEEYQKALRNSKRDPDTFGECELIEIQIYPF
jgi:hypothetical protein